MQTVAVTGSSSFQSLFCWKSVWEAAATATTTVSVDCFNPCFVGNRSGRVTENKTATTQVGFNPCFVGNRSGRPKASRQRPAAGSFNPCFVGNRSGRVYSPVMGVLFSLFQSLFCWKSVWELFNYSGLGDSGIVSILVLLEIGLGEFCKRCFIT